MPGPLQGLKVVELAGIGPAPLAAMLLADLGAEVSRVERSGPAGTHLPFDPAASLLNRGKQVLPLDLKHPADLARALEFVSRADVLIESYRPGVAERLGMGPEECMSRNPRLVYARITGWGRSGPLAAVAGHDLNYIALTGALAAIGPRGGKPAIPLNLLGDFGGGSLYLVFGILAALFERTTSGRGQVVDAAMIDGVASLMTSLYSQWAAGTIELQRGSNLVDGGAPFYEVYETADAAWVSVAAIEPKFFAELVDILDVDRGFIARQYDKSCWPALRQAFEQRFRSKSRDAWCELLATRDVCFAPVLDLEEATRHPHHVARGTFCRVNGIVQPAPSPRFARTPAATSAAPVERGPKAP